ncbi:MAG: aldo/keto reductase [Anaerolineales bacterium]|nr:aldo/keto reductase [Anaerolineales bacterium]
MRYKLFGKSGLRVSELALGTMTFGPEWGWGASKEESQKIFEAYMEAGGNFIDTANRYTEGTAEKLVGEFIASDRDHFVLATKYSLFMRRDDPNFSGNHRKNMVHSLEASLKRLNTDYIDLYWVHAWDYMTPVEEVMRALDDLVRAGKILYVGISDTPAWIVSQANTLAELRGWSRFVGVQLQYSLIERNIERELLPLARETDMAVTAWGALGAGVLSGKYNNNTSAEGRAALWGSISDKNLRIAQTVSEVAQELERTPSQVAINWVRQQPGVMIPLIGAKKADQVKDNLACLDFTLTDEHLARLNEVSKIELGFPYDFLTSDGVRDLVYGGTFDKIDNHRV